MRPGPSTRPRAQPAGGELFGGFTPTYVDLVSLFTVRTCAERAAPTGRLGLATTTMRVDYFEPIVRPTFVIEGRREMQRGRNHHVLVRFLQDGLLSVLAATTMREITGQRSLGDT